MIHWLIDLLFCSNLSHQSSNSTQTSSIQSIITQHNQPMVINNDKGETFDLPKKKVYIGHEVHKLLQFPLLARDYEIIRPIKRGQLHVGNLDGEFHSIQSISLHLTDLLIAVFERYCGVRRLMLPSYKLILLIPDQFLKRDVKVLLKIALWDLNFQAVIVHQESVCASFAAAVHSACVVDIGHQKISVCCVEEGISLPATRFVFHCSSGIVICP